MEATKPVNTLILDTGGIIRNEPSVSTLIAKAENLITVPAIISEIKDAVTRSRVETTLMPFLNLRTPTPASVKFVTDFARRTGDLAVLSKPDIQIIALTYEVECELNNGDWRLRRTPGQKGMNGSPPSKGEKTAEEDEAQVEEVAKVEAQPAPKAPWARPAGVDTEKPSQAEEANGVAPAPHVELPGITRGPTTEGGAQSQTTQEDTTVDPDGGVELTSEAQLADRLANTSMQDPVPQETTETSDPPKVDSTQASASDPSAESSDETSSDDGGGWITPSNLKRKQALDTNSNLKTKASEPKTMRAAVMTTDFAMQNVLLQIGLNLLSPNLQRVKYLKSYVLRCHACFTISKDMSKQFCSKCGKPTLTRVSCSTDASGEFKVHLKKNMQWNNKGERYSIPKPVHGSANGRVKGGGKGHWGNELILAEDQKEYQRAVGVEKKSKERGLMDEDYLPGILTGDRNRAGGRIKVGAGRNVNSKKRN